MIYTLQFRPAPGWSNIRRFNNTTQELTVNPGKQGIPNTGLTQEDERRLEAAIGLEKNELAKQSKYWYDFSIRLFNGEILELDDQDPWGELQIKVCKANKLVATSPQTVGSETRFILLSPDVELKTEEDRVGLKQKARKEIAKLSLEKIKQYALLTKPNEVISVDSMSEDSVSDLLYGFAERNPAKFLDMLADKKAGYKAKVLQMIAKRVLYRKGTAVLSVDDDAIIGVDIDDAADYLENKKNSVTTSTLYARLEAAG